MQFRYDIQGLRALAVVFVLIFHLDKTWLPGGFIGVDMFFVISGYLISSILINKKSNGTFSFLDFYLGRIKRIVPAYFVFLIVTTILTAIIYLPIDVNKYRIALFWASLFNSNNYFATLDTYFGATSSENPLLHTWTLAIEMQFYFFLPLIVVFLPFKKVKNILVILTISLLCYSSFNILSLGNKDAMYFSLLARSPEFFLGVLLNYFALERNYSKKTANLLSFIGLFLLIVSLIFLNESSPFPGFFAIFPCLGACLLLISKGSSVNKILSRKPFVYIGELSYSIYLWHWPALALYRYANGEYELRNYFHILFLLVIIFILSWISYNYIERSFRQKGLDKRFILGFSTIIILLGTSALTIKKINSKFSTIPLEFSSPSAHGLNSHGSTYNLDEIRGDVRSSDTLLLLGDSHALTMKSYFELLGMRNNFCFRSVTNDRFPPIPGINLDEIPLQYRSRQKNLTSISSDKLKNSKIIVLVRAWSVEIPSFEPAMETLIRKLDSSQHLIVFLDYPSVNANPIKIARQFTRPRKSDFNWNVIAGTSPGYIQTMSKKYKNVHVLDFSASKAFADAPFYNDTIMYYDPGHLNKFGAEKYALETESEFVSLLNSIRE